MIGIDRDSGATVDDWLQFVQRATRALTTPLGTRQKRPLYGSLIPTLLVGDYLFVEKFVRFFHFDAAAARCRLGKNRQQCTDDILRH